MDSNTTNTPLPTHGWTIQKIRDLTEKKFGKRACWYQVRTALAVYEGKDVVGCAQTGAGKTLSFWIPLLMAQEDGKEKMSFVVTPLNLLGKQNVQVLQEAGLSAIAVSKENANPKTFKDIENGKYRVVVVNPEILMGSDEMEKLWKKPQVTKQIQSFIFDEGHCISQWSEFRKEYLRVGNLRYLIPEKIPFYVASATLPPPILVEITEILKLRPKETVHIIYSNERPEIRLMVRGLVCAASSFQDLAFLIDNYHEGDGPIAPFIIFFDNTKEAERACKYLRTLLPRSSWHKIRWFHSTMTQYFRETQVEAMKSGEVWGLCCTDAFGMGMDLPDISIVVQWKATCDMCSLWQRFGRGARGSGRTATAILLVEKKDTEEERRSKAEKAAKRKEKSKEGVGTKRKATHDPNNRPTKRPALQDCTPNGNSLDMATHGPRTGADVVLQEERRKLYREGATMDNRKKGRGKGRDMEVSMNDFINAVHVPFHCRRIVPTLTFENDKTRNADCQLLATGHHLLCDPSNKDGCLRCRPRILDICCDLCNPEYFEKYNVSVPDKTGRMASKSHLKPFNPTSQSTNLKKALDTWRKEAALSKFNAATIRTLGIRIFMPEQVLNRIVACAHYGKVSTLEDLRKEIDWTQERVMEYGNDILSLVSLSYPVVPEDPVDPSAPVRKRAQVRCSACKALGHNSSNRQCPKRVQQQEDVENQENIAPNLSSSHYRPQPNTTTPSTSTPSGLYRGF